MSMIENAYTEMYKDYTVTPSWQKIERYEYCDPYSPNHAGTKYLKKIRKWFKKRV